MNVLVVFQDKFLSLINAIVEHSCVQMDVKAISLDEDNTKRYPFATYSLNDCYLLCDNSFDVAFLGTEIIDQSRSLLAKMFHDSLPMYDLSDAAETFATDVGKVHFLKERVDFLYPRPKLSYVNIGDFSYFNEMKVMSELRQGEVRLDIGRFCAIGPGLTVLLGEEHRIDWVSTYPFDDMISGYESPEKSTFSKGDVVIGNDVWIGNNVTVLSGLTIGDGCVIASNSVVTKSIPPYTVVGGNPAKQIRKRFSDELVERLSKMSWWNWEYDKIYGALKLLQSDDLEGLWEYYKSWC